MNFTKKLFNLYTIIFASVMLFSCATLPTGKNVSRTLTDPGIKTAKQLENFFISQNPSCSKKEVRELSKLYIKEANAEGINSDCAFVQMCLETGFLKFGNLVTKEMHNYCGLGAIDAEHPGESFDTAQLGVRAHIQHLHAYATDETFELNNKCIDNRYKWVKRGRAKDIYGLSGTWAMDSEYSKKLDALLTKLEKF